MYFPALCRTLKGMHTGGGWRLGHRPGLDGLRGVAIGLVMLAHIWPHYLEDLGMVGVTLFFGLSGFLITALLLEERQRTSAVSLRKFYVRRARRLLPALVPVLLVASVIETHLGANPVGEILVVLTYTSNWATAFGAPMTLLAHTWSLAVEEQFYLIWPVVLSVALARHRPVRRIAAWCLIGAGVSLGLRLTLWAFGVNQTFIDAGTPTRADALLIGCALAAALHAGWRPTRGRVAVLCVPLVAAGVTYATLVNHVPTRIAMPTLTTLAVVPLLLLALGSPRLLTNPVLRWLGRRSYALYLWHYVLVVPTNWGLSPLPVWVDVVLSLTAAEASWWLVERPFLRRKPATGLVVAASPTRTVLVRLRRRPDPA